MEERNNPFPGAIPMVRIDGTRIRRLREGKGLTQLYISTVVGVTTDTISRWENRHYQSIKLDNAEKLAGALEVRLEEILEQSPPEPEPAAGQTTAGPEMPPPGRRQLKWLGLTVAVFALAVVAVLLYALFPKQQRGTVAAVRFLPPQCPPGQSFPVLIKIRVTGPDPISLLLREILPEGSTSLRADPAPTTVDRGENSLKWIGRAETGESVYAYLCQVAPAAPFGETLTFSGTVTRKQTLGEQAVVTGAVALTVAPFHWADTNRDQVIDDEEILAVYDQYSGVKTLDFDLDLIDAIWAGSGYRWDEKKKKYLVVK